MSKLTDKQARAEIAKIREKNGGISPKDRAVTPKGVLRSLRNVRRKLGAATKTLAKNLYSKDTRFVYELIQNAEDNKYTVSNVEAFIRFTIESDRIIIDSNEDGFTTRDVKAICSIGESTKTSVQGYIGEKGIGFKSVFKIAKKVHVQSGPFSFAFEYARKPDDDRTHDLDEENIGSSDDEHSGDSDDASTGDSDDTSTGDSEDDGLGMVTPMEEAHEDLPADVRTRITLTLIDSPMTEERCDELFDIPDTLLLFLSKLRTISINRHLFNENETSTIYQCRFDKGLNTAVTTKKTCIGSKTTLTESMFRVVKKEITGLPADEARRRRNFDRATVVLAFPVDAEEQPHIASQHVFAFLPLRQVGFTFLIQADFITQASREDIFDSPRNRQLLDGVAATFCEAVLGFCQHPTLVYHWVKYLPDDSISDAFWKQLRPKIITFLAETPILRTQSESLLYKPTQLRTVSSNFVDVHGDPLFEDLTRAEIYLSRGYDVADWSRLRSLGVRTINFGEALDRVEADLLRPKSMIKGDVKSVDWRKRVFTFLSTPFEEDYLSARGRIERFPIIPLQDGRWVSAQSLPIYFPTTGLSTIPQDLGLNLVSQPATTLLSRNRLFKHLGVVSCEAKEVISRIYSHYSLASWKPLSSHIHLHYLFENLPETANDVNTKVWLLGENLEKVWLSGPRKEHMYFEEPGNPYGPGQVLRVKSLFGNYNSLLSSGVHFIHPASVTYSGDTDSHGRTYDRWLEEVFRVHRCPQLLHPLKPELSKEFAHIIKQCPEKLVSVLREYWPTYKPLISQYGLCETLKASKVPVEMSEEFVALSNSYLPLPKLKGVMTDAGVSTASLFLKLSIKLLDEDQEKWEFLKTFGVGVRDDARLHLRALERQASSSVRSIDANRVISVYAQIAKRSYTEEDIELIRSQFKSSRMIYLPRDGSPLQCTWFGNDDCVWSGPQWLTTKQRLDETYKSLESFFRLTLNIRDFEWRDCLSELEDLKEKQERQLGKVAPIYHRLMLDFKHHSNWDELRSEFEQRQLVLVPEENVWHPLSSCIWAESRIRVPKKHSIATFYAEITDFFVQILGVPRPDLGMHVQTLKDLHRVKDKDAKWLSLVKDTMMLISSMDPKANDLTPLRATNIFPVRTRQGDVRPTSSQVEFAIMDRPEFQGLFPEIVVLDFTLQEVHTFKRFLSAMGLAGKHMSVLVEERTTVDDGCLDSSLTEFLRSRAYALFRCAVYYNSAKARDNDISLFGQLRQAETLTSERISKSMTLVQNSEEHRAEQQKANFHLDESQEKLQLYVPKKRSDRELCYLRQLPRRLMRFLAISDPAAEAVISGVVNSSRLSIVDEILKDAGVIEIDSMQRPPEVDEDEQQVSDEAASSTEGSSSADGVQMPSRSSGSSERYMGTRSPSHSQQPWGALPFGHILLSPPRSASPSPSATSENVEYARLLDRLIDAASNAALPIHNASAFVTSGNGHLYTRKTMFGPRSPERNNKVGAAGELFVFELLSQLGLPNFGRANWQSTIRHYAQVCDKYQDLDVWNGLFETTDITYNDGTNMLSQLLVEKGYDMVSHFASLNQRKFYIEVKTTTGDWDEPFYVSGSQYERMQSLRPVPDKPWKEIYLIMRVFKVESARVGLRIYVDPIAAKERGELRFTVDTWKVKSI